MNPGMEYHVAARVMCFLKGVTQEADVIVANILAGVFSFYPSDGRCLPFD